MMTTTPDAALLWAREQIAGLVERNNEAAAVMRGESREDEVDVLAEAFRAGQSHADAALLAALEACVAELTELYGEVLPDTKREGRERVKSDPVLVRARAAIAAAKGGRDAG